jgi:hypothetical protein
MIASLSGAMLNLVFIMALGRVYEKLAYTLTSWGRLSFEFFPLFLNIFGPRPLLLLFSTKTMH